jgi:hypothetical protein
MSSRVIDVLSIPHCEHCFNNTFSELNYVLKPNGLVYYICDNCLDLAKISEEYK